MPWVTILYKSGNKVHMRVDEMTVKWNRSTSEVTSVEWKGADKDAGPIFLGLDNVEAVWNGKV